jgi:hypothetical protein
MLSLPKVFSGPLQVKPLVEDHGLSSGANSWMSVSNASFLLMDLTMVKDDDYFANSQLAVRTFSY